jgi:DNA-binding response OmpR family regulator
MITFMPAPVRETTPILVVDDDPKIVALVRTYLERERYRVVTASTGRAALREIADHPRLVVLDLMIPELDGIEVIRRARLFGDVPILVLSARGAVGDRIQALTEGADDYLPKPFSPAELVVRVRTILRRTERGGGPEDGVLAVAGLELDVGRHQATVDGTPVPLSALELRLLAALLEADGRVLTRDQLLDAIHGVGEGDITDRAIDQYVKRLREKLGDDPAAPRFVATVRGAGYRAANPVERRAGRGHCATASRPLPGCTLAVAGVALGIVAVGVLRVGGASRRS